MNSSTRVSLVAAAVAAALGTVATAAPLLPSSWPGYTPTGSSTPNPGKVYYAGGGSAEVQAVFVAVNKLLTNVTVITDGSGGDVAQSNSYLIVLGNAAKNFETGVTSGSVIGFIYKYNGGSGPNGAVPEFTTSASFKTLPYPAASVIGVAGGFGAYINGSTVTSVNPNYVLTPGATTTVAPDWGITDEEPGLFNYSWNAASTTQPAFSTSNGTAKPLYVAPFGVAVTQNVYQYKHNFAKAEIAQILAGQVSDWSALIGDTGTYKGSPLPAGPIVLLDRSPGSGTRAGAYAYFLNYPLGGLTTLGGDVEPYDIATGFTNSTGSLYDHLPTLQAEGLGLGGTEPYDVKEGSSVVEVNDLVAANKNTVGAIALLGLEFPPAQNQGGTGSNQYYFASINGTYPDSQTSGDNVNDTTTTATTTYSNIVKGLYDYAVQTSFNTPSGSTVATTNGTAFEQQVYTILSSQAISGAHVGSLFPSATQGVLLDPKIWSTPAAGVVEWSRNAVTVAAPFYTGAEPSAAADPL